MIKGIGIDLIEIERINNAIIRNNKFLQRVFTPKEIQYFDEKNNRPNTIAGNFAAKEAVMKALGTGLREFKWTDIEILRDDLGKPVAFLHNKAKEIAENKDMVQILVSISHSKNCAVAQALVI